MRKRYGYYIEFSVPDASGCDAWEAEVLDDALDIANRYAEDHHGWRTRKTENRDKANAKKGKP
jgi:hypothetical protein